MNIENEINVQWSQAELAQVPTTAPIRRASTGDLMKVSFATENLISPSTRRELDSYGGCIVGESLWVLVSEISGSWPDLQIRGTLDNSPIMIDPQYLEFGSEIMFRPNHVIDVQLRAQKPARSKDDQKFLELGTRKVFFSLSERAAKARSKIR